MYLIFIIAQPNLHVEKEVSLDYVWSKAKNKEYGVVKGH